MDTEEKMNADYIAWFAKLQALTSRDLAPQDWVTRWFDGYSPSEALEEGPADD